MAVIKYEKGGKYYYLVAGNEANAVTYDVSATEADKVKLSIIPIGDGTYLAKLTGYGATKNFASADVKPWDKYIPTISAIEIGAGVTSIGERLFRRHEAVKSLVFEDSDSIKHLGKQAFQGCQFGGEYSFPNLEDEEFAAAFSHCPNLRGLTLNSNVKSLATGAVTSCISLRYVHGLGGIQTVGQGAFHYTPQLESLDLDPAVCTSFVDSAFLVSGNAMRYANTSVWNKTQVGADAIPAESYSAVMLEKIRAVGLPNATPNEVNADGQYQYADIPFGKRNGSQLNVSGDGCQALALYHLFNWYNGAVYENFRDFWEKEITSKNPQIIDNDINQMQAAMANTLGWTERAGFPVKIKDDPEAAKRAIATELAAGRALVVNIVLAGALGHSVAIIGSNAVTDKLTIADSIRISGDKGNIYDVSIEQLFADYDSCMVRSYEVV